MKTDDKVRVLAIAINNLILQHGLELDDETKTYINAIVKGEI